MKTLRRIACLPALFMLLVCLAACGTVRTEQAVEPEKPEQEETVQNTEAEAPADPIAEAADIAAENAPLEEGDNMIYAHIGEETLKIRPAANSSAEAFAALLADGDITVEMSDYGGFEKVGPLGVSIATNDERITTEPGDVILYQGNQITIYYAENTWTFTRLGKVEDLTPDELREILGDGDPTVVFSLK